MTKAKFQKGHPFSSACLDISRLWSWVCWIKNSCYISMLLAGSTLMWTDVHIYLKPIAASTSEGCTQWPVEGRAFRRLRYPLHITVSVDVLSLTVLERFPVNVNPHSLGKFAAMCLCTAVCSVWPLLRRGHHGADHKNPWRPTRWQRYVQALNGLQQYNTHVHLPWLNETAPVSLHGLCLTGPSATCESVWQGLGKCPALTLTTTLLLASHLMILDLSALF